MNDNVTNLLAARQRRRRPALHFDTDLEALLFAAKCLADLHRTAVKGELAPDVLALKLDQAGSVIDACIRLHGTTATTTGDPK